MSQPSANSRSIENVVEKYFQHDKIISIVKECKIKTTNEFQQQFGNTLSNIKYDLILKGSNRLHTSSCYKEIQLQHSLLNHNSNVCVIVNDSDGSIQSYEDILRPFIKNFDVISLRQLMSIPDVSQNLVAYEKILVSQPIENIVNRLIGDELISTGQNHLPIPVRLSENDLQTEITLALRKGYKRSSGDLIYAIEVGRNTMSDEAIADNIIDLVRKINDIHSGGFSDIYQLLLKPQTFYQTKSRRFEFKRAAILYEQKETCMSFTWWKKRPGWMCAVIISCVLIILAIIYCFGVLV